MSAIEIPSVGQALRRRTRPRRLLATSRRAKLVELRRRVGSGGDAAIGSERRRRERRRPGPAERQEDDPAAGAELPGGPRARLAGEARARRIRVDAEEEAADDGKRRRDHQQDRVVEPAAERGRAARRSRRRSCASLQSGQAESERRQEHARRASRTSSDASGGPSSTPKILSDRGRRVKVVEHHVHDDAGHRDVEPDRQRPPRDPPVPVVAALQAQVERPQRRAAGSPRRGSCARSGSRSRPRADGPLPVKRTDPTCAWYVEVRDEKERRRRGGREHQRAVPLDLEPPDGAVAEDDEDALVAFRQALRVGSALAERHLERGSAGLELAGLVAALLNDPDRHDAVRTGR